MYTWSFACAATATVTLTVLLFAIYKKSSPGEYIFKPLTSLLFLLAATAGNFELPFTRWIFAGLVFCLLGDILLMFAKKAYFLSGLIAFLTGHILYIAAYRLLLPPGFCYMPLWSFVLLAFISIAIYLLLIARVKEMRVPVTVYAIVISIMLYCAWGIFFQGRLPITRRLLIALGASCFYLSDIFVAMDRFVHNRFANRLLGLPLYYLGQFMLAFSVLV